MLLLRTDGGEQVFCLWRDNVERSFVISQNRFDLRRGDKPFAKRYGCKLVEALKHKRLTRSCRTQEELCRELMPGSLTRIHRIDKDVGVEGISIGHGRIAHLD